MPKPSSDYIIPLYRTVPPVWLTAENIKALSIDVDKLPVNVDVEHVQSVENLESTLQSFKFVPGVLGIDMHAKKTITRPIKKRGAKRKVTLEILQGFGRRLEENRKTKAHSLNDLYRFAIKETDIKCGTTIRNFLRNYMPLLPSKPSRIKDLTLDQIQQIWHLSNPSKAHQKEKRI